MISENKKRISISLSKELVDFIDKERDIDGFSLTRSEYIEFVFHNLIGHKLKDNN